MDDNDKKMKDKPLLRGYSSRKLWFVQALVVLGLAAIGRPNCQVWVQAAKHSASESDLTIIDHDGSVAATAAADELSRKEFSSGRNSAHQDRHQQLDGILVVVAVDGTMAGISRSNGELLWKKLQSSSGTTSASTDQQGRMQQPPKWSSPTGSESAEREDAAMERLFRPLLSTTTTTQTAATSDYAAVPCMDGNVYLTGGNNHNKGGGEIATTTVCTSVKELVQRAPFLDPQGRFYVASQQTTAAAIDALTGEILRVVPSSSNNKEKAEDDEIDLPDDVDRPVVWVGRVDYSVTVQDARTGIRSVQFSVSEIQTVPDLRKRSTSSSSSSGLSDPWAEQWNTVLPSSRLAEDGEKGQYALQQHQQQWADVTKMRLVSTPSGNLALMNPDTGRVEWVASEQFQTPVAFGLLANGRQTVPVDIVPDVTVPSSNDVEYLSRELERQVQLLDSGTSSSHSEDNEDEGEYQTIVGRLEGNGQLYALPLGKRRPSHTFATGGTSSLPHSSNHHYAAAIASMAAAKHKTFPQLTGTARLSHHHHQDMDSTLTRKPCHPTSPHFPSCLVDHHKYQPPRLEYFAKGSDNKFTSEGLPPLMSTTQKDDAHGLALVHKRHGAATTGYSFSPENTLVYHPEYGYVVDPHLFSSTRPEKKSRYSKVLKILGSWLPPTIALIFVLSFELGRRKRLKDEKQQTGMGTAKEMADSNGASSTRGSAQNESLVNGVGEASSSTELLSESAGTSRTPPQSGPFVPQQQQMVAEEQQQQQQQQQHVIQVSDQVLGYGGQGTVVYKGILDGREVAVKRMLKAYHASADREIRLLIESDGHPNVVRYFLKEARGDFVYLALELCDLSLHDLIGVLRTTETINQPAATIPLAATKFVLQQIASGVRHLHSLRIVHRDLKPANILLAITKSGKKRQQAKEQTEANTLDSFLECSYLAKISDMGLGKQIVGQSSLGASLMAASSFQGTKGGTSSVGVGPGSVGWQAPEVMALRWVASDSSARSGENSNPDASPIDLPSPTTTTSRSVDIFSLGCIFYSTLVPGHHPFGEWYEREANIVHNRPSMDALEKISPDAFQLVRSMLSRDPKLRPPAKQICEHPFFWTSQKKLSFLCEFSDRLETDTTVPSSIQSIGSLAIERGAVDVVGTSWDERLDDPLISNMQRFRTYDPSSVRDLLRLIRNKHHHFDELPEDFRATRVATQDALLEYFEEKFPRLLMHCWNCCRSSLTGDDPLLVKYDAPPLPTKPCVSKIDPSATSAPESVVVQPLSDDCPDGEANDLQEDGDDSVSKAKETTEEDGARPVGVKSDDWDYVEELHVETSNDKGDAEQQQEPALVHSSIQPEDFENLIAWEGSTAARELNCRGWSRSDTDWARRIDPVYRKKDANLKRAAEDPKFRTRLCNHWDESLGTFCPMRKRNKCVFAHGPVELRVKEGKKNRWGKLVDKNGDNKNPRHSGGEDTYGAARTIEVTRKEEGKWNTNSKTSKGKKHVGGGKKKNTPQAALSS